MKASCVIILSISFASKVFCAPWTLNGPVQRNLDEDVRDDDVELEAESSKTDRVMTEDDYHTYMEKKVARIVYKGGQYIEGLRGALDKYADTLENCHRNYNKINYTDPAQLSTLVKCQEATAESERLRKVAQLALWTIKQIQERGLRETHGYEEDNDKMLLLRLAWLLDRLAHMTGYDPKPEDFLTTSSSAPSTVTLAPIAMAADALLPQLNVTDSLKMRMLNCLNSNSSGNESGTWKPAYERCPPEIPMLPPLRRLFNITGDTRPIIPSRSRDSTESQNVTNTRVSPKITENGNQSTARVKSATKPIKNERRRREVNTETGPQKYNKWNYKLETSNFPQNAYYSRIYQEQFSKGFKDYNNLDRPKERSRIPQDPYQDISFYLKSKPGTNVEVDLVEANRLRLSLEQAFQNPNIEIVRRYGSNYNPLVPNVYASGVLKSFSDA